MTNLEHIKSITDRIKLDFQGKEVILFVEERENGDITLQVGMERPCTYTKKVSIGKGGEVYVSQLATEDEVVKKVLGLYLSYVEHEAREGFLYDGVRVFNPHVTIDALKSVAKKSDWRGKTKK